MTEELSCQWYRESLGKVLFKVVAGDKEIWLLGTAHISQQSVIDVEKAVAEIKPDTLCVELCKARYHNLRHSFEWQNLDIFKILREKKGYLLFFHLLISSLQKKMAKQLDIVLGAEQIKGIELAESQGISLELIDRDVSVTLRRAWFSLSIVEKAKFLSMLVSSLWNTPKVSEEEVEKLKEHDVLSKYIEELSVSLPSIKRVLIDERDMYLAQKIKKSEGKVIVAVVGKGHVEGIRKNIEREVDTEELEKVAPPSRVSFYLKWAFPLILIGVFVYSFTLADKNISQEVALRWILANGIFAGLGALLSRAHILTVISAIVAAPFTSLNPAIAAGWVSGFVEAWLCRPQVKDFENIVRDFSSYKTIVNNNALRVILVVILTNAGSAIGTIVGIPLITMLFY